jgi:hypothetical protein
MATLFFAMLISLALGSIFGAFETVITALSDQWPVLRQHKPRLVMATAASMALLGLPFACPAGIHMFTLFNESAPSWNLLLFAFLEVIIISWIYGVDKFLLHVEDMTVGLNYWLKGYWWVCWKYLTPLVLFTLLLLEFASFGHVRYEDYVYPLPIQLLGYGITGCSIVWIPIFSFLEQRKSTDADTTTTSTTTTGSSMWLLKPTAVSTINTCNVFKRK